MIFNDDVLYVNHKKSSLLAFPTYIFELDFVEEIDLSNNYIDTIPHNLKQLIYLRFINLSFNYFYDFPLDILNCHSLKILNLQGNYITKISNEIIKLDNLESLDLSYNNIIELESSIFVLPALRILNLSHNKIQSFLEGASLDFQRSQLNYLDLSFNQLKRAPTTLSKLSRLETLNMVNNCFNISRYSIYSLHKSKTKNLNCYFDISYNINNIEEIAPGFNRLLTVLNPILVDRHYTNKKLNTKLIIDELLSGALLVEFAQLLLPGCIVSSKSTKNNHDAFLNLCLIRGVSKDCLYCPGPFKSHDTEIPIDLNPMAHCLSCFLSVCRTPSIKDHFIGLFCCLTLFILTPGFLILITRFMVENI